jgi:hypothetical protein
LILVRLIRILWFNYDLYGSRPFECYGLYISFRASKSRRLDRFCSGGFQPTEEENDQFSEFRRNETFKMGRAYGSQMEFYIVFRWVETHRYKIPSSLQIFFQLEKMGINRSLQKDDFRINHRRIDITSYFQKNKNRMAWFKIHTILIL